MVRLATSCNRWLRYSKPVIFVGYQLSVIRLATLVYPVAEVLEARYQLSVVRLATLVYPVAEVLEAELFLVIHHLRNHINLINHSSDNFDG